MVSLRLSRDVKLSQEMLAPASDVLAVLRDPKRMARLSPIVTDVEADPDDPTKLRLTEVVTIAFGFTTKVNFTTRMYALDEGALYEVEAPMWVTTSNRYTVKAKDETSCIVTQNVLVKVKPTHGGATC